ncbi:MAG: VOC family protein [Alphaproteobacteria bacterium]|nr:VOC family protein [Alphaproteobacteria bacterium]
MFKKIDHVAVHCTELERSLTFYQNAFGFEFVNRMQRPDGGGIAYLRLGGTVLELTEKVGEERSGYHFAITTDDMDAAIAHLEEQGVPVLVEAAPAKAKMPGEGDTRRAVYAGPDGEMIEVRG